MRDGRLTYDATTYRLTPAVIDELLARGVIVADPLYRDQFELAPDHLIDEVELVAGAATFATGDDRRGESAAGDEGRRHFAVRLSERNGFGANR
jgi:hypothetical protein